LVLAQHLFNIVEDLLRPDYTTKGNGLKNSTS